MIDQCLLFGNAEPVSLADIPLLSAELFRECCSELHANHCTPSAFFASPVRGMQTVVAVFSDAVNSTLRACATPLVNPWESVTPVCPPLAVFERGLAEDHGIRLNNHPFPAPLRFAPTIDEQRTGVWPKRISPGSGLFAGVSGDDEHEVAVGPVHAGIIEPGHFRFSCSGEIVDHLQIVLGYQHRGIERALRGGPHLRTRYQMETAAGDTTIGHTLAYVQLIEGCSWTMVPPRAAVLRGIALELERCANHVGDLGALALDAGYLPTSAFCGRLRGEYLNMTAMLCGSRFGRSFIREGGVGFNPDAATISSLSTRLKKAWIDTRRAVELMFAEPSVMARFEGIGGISRKIAYDLGMVGPAARACGVVRDIRSDFPAGIWQFAHIPVSVAESGDVFARAHVRWLEVERSVAFIADQLKRLPSGVAGVNVTSSLPAEALCVSLVEGWRGEICHAAVTDAEGLFASYVIVDPSMHNWEGLSLALRGQQISDFPLCNKSFNLSYCGFDR